MSRLHLATLLPILLASPAFAGITPLGGPTTAVPLPVNQKYNADAYNINTFFYWTERTSVTLSSNLVVSILPPGSFPNDSLSHADNNTLFITAGTVVDSYNIVYDPVGDSSIARFQFDAPVLGLITNSRDSLPADDHFLLSDFLIDPAVPAANIPAAHYDARGIEPNGTTNADFVRWINPTTIELHIGASTPGDQIRVITAAVPEPASLSLLILGLAALVNRRRLK